MQQLQWPYCNNASLYTQNKVNVTHQLTAGVNYQPRRPCSTGGRGPRGPRHGALNIFQHVTLACSVTFYCFRKYSTDPQLQNK